MLATAQPANAPTQPDNPEEAWRRIERMYRGEHTTPRFLESGDGVLILGLEGEPLYYIRPRASNPPSAPEKPRGDSLEETVTPIEILSDVGNF